jgi:hypothetical protein
MKRATLGYTASLLALYLAAAAAPANATTSPSDPRTKSEAGTLARRQAMCAKKGKVVLATRIGDTLYYRCILPEDPRNKGQ